MIDPHSQGQKDLPIKIQILNISVNMARIASLVGSKDKADLVKKFMDQTSAYLEDISSQDVSENFKPTLKRFKEEFKELKNQGANNNNKALWAERALTWADILQIRANLA